MFSLGSLKLLLRKKILASAAVVAGSGATGAYFLLREKEMDVPERVASTKAKMLVSRPVYFRLLQDIKSKGPDKIPEGLRSAYEWRDNPVMSERWAALFCEDGQYDINENNYRDYQEFCGAGL